MCFLQRSWCGDGNHTSTPSQLDILGIPDRSFTSLQLILCGLVESPPLKVTLLTLSMCLSTLTSGGALCNHLDISNQVRFMLIMMICILNMIRFMLKLI